MSTSDFIKSTDKQGTGGGLRLSPELHYNGSVCTPCNGHGRDTTAEQTPSDECSVFKSVQVKADDDLKFSAGATVGSVEELARKVQSALQMEEEFEEMFEYPEGYLKTRHNTAADTETAENECSKLEPHFESQSTCQKAENLSLPQLGGFTKRDSKREPIRTEDKYRLLYSIEVSDSSEEDVGEDWLHRTPKSDSASFPRAAVTVRKLGIGSVAEQGLASIIGDPHLSYSDFEDEYFAGNCTNNGELPTPPKSTKPEPLNKQSRADYDHSFTPLHAIGVAQLKELLTSLQKRVQGMYHY